MIGAIDFMRAWRDVCDKSEDCTSCPIYGTCLGSCVAQTDKDINDLITAVEKARREANAERKNNTTDT